MIWLFSNKLMRLFSRRISFLTYVVWLGSIFNYLFYLFFNYLFYLFIYLADDEDGHRYTQAFVCNASLIVAIDFCDKSFNMRFT